MKLTHDGVVTGESFGHYPGNFREIAGLLPLDNPRASACAGWLRTEADRLGTLVAESPTETDAQRWRAALEEINEKTPNPVAKKALTRAVQV